ncbi:MAG: phosphodiester glycosidase family protein [Gemmataceae bacterium]|nr:phosphodiester glycosidase family protein [Gemmataceae bacterium]
MPTAIRQLCLIAFAVLGLGADFPKPKVAEESKPFGPIRITRYEFDQPRPIRAWAARIDLTSPDIEFVLTPAGKVPEGFHTLSATTLEFAQAEGLQLAVNGSPFAPMRLRAGEPQKINGLHLTRGEVIASPPAKSEYGALLLSGVNRPSIRKHPITPEDLAATRNGLSGFHVIVADGKHLKEDQAEPIHPRTAAGISDGGKYLWLLVVDGRQPGTSEGMSYLDLGNWAKSLGISDLLNLDGGGSTTLVVQDPATGQHAVANSPIGRGTVGSLRLNGNNLGVRVYDRPGDLTAGQLRAIMPRLPAERVPLFLGPINRALAQYKIDSPLRRAAFLAQLAHESGELKYMEEIASGEAYEGRANLGNTQPGDGKRFKGRGPIQLTGRNNYRKAGQALGMELEEHPERVADPEIGCRVAGWFWDTRKLNDLADKGDFKEITRKVNGGFRGLEKREAYYKVAKKVLGAEDKPGP